MAKSKPWTESECSACVALYFSMLHLTINERPLNKRAAIRAAQQNSDLELRSRQSVEMKLMNVTACLIDLSYTGETMQEHGYRPLSSYQGILKAAVADWVATTTPLLERDDAEELTRTGGRSC